MPELSNRDKVLLQRALMKHATEVLDYRDLNEAQRVVADGLHLNDNVSLINSDNVIIRNCIVFKIMESMKIWLMSI
jgi:hypothetical protein